MGHYSTMWYYIFAFKLYIFVKFHETHQTICVFLIWGKLSSQKCFITSTASPSRANVVKEIDSTPTGLPTFRQQNVGSKSCHTSFCLKSGEFQNNPKSHQIFWQLLCEGLLPSKFINRPIWSHCLFVTLAVAQLAEWSLQIPENPSSNPAIANFYWT